MRDTQKVTANIDTGSTTAVFDIVVTQNDPRKLFVVSDTDVVLPSDKPLIGVGGGDWLSEKKADEQMEASAGRWIQMVLTTDSNVVPEANPQT